MSCSWFFGVVQLTDAASVCGLGMDRISDPYVRPIIWIVGQNNIRLNSFLDYFVGDKYKDNYKSKNLYTDILWLCFIMSNIVSGQDIRPGTECEKSRISGSTVICAFSVPSDWFRVFLRPPKSNYCGVKERICQSK